MKRIREPAKDIPVIAKTDVLVVGGGPAGLAAALGAAREGATTMLVERYGFFGGVITQAMVETIAWYRHEQTVDANGIGCEFERRAREATGARDYFTGHSACLHTDIFKYVADEMIREAGVTPLLHCLAVGPIMHQDVIQGVLIESKSGRQAILAKRVVDATGDADIAARAGAPYTQVEATKRQNRDLHPKDTLFPVTVGFCMTGVDAGKFAAYVEANPTYIKDWAPRTTGKEDDVRSNNLVQVVRKAVEAGVIPEGVVMNGFWDSITEEGEARGLNMTRVCGVDPTDVWDLTRGEMEGRQQVTYAVEALRTFAPGFEEAKLAATGSAVGVRESRIIVGEYMLTEEDVRNQASFEDSIGVFPEFLDGYEWVVIPTTGRYFQVPYRITVPLEVENLLVAGRSVAGDRVSHAATRQMMCCTVTGQGAGVAAAVSIDDGVVVREVDVARVQEGLERQGVRIK